MIELSEIHTNRINNIRTLTTFNYKDLQYSVPKSFSQD
jgi:hypothetical protein